MLKSRLENDIKFKILAIITGVLVAIGIPAFLPHYSHGHGLHVTIHLAGIVIGTFLSVVSAITFLEYKTKRLLLVFLAFFSITIAEVLAASNMIFLFWPAYSSVDSMITHFLILMMLTFFAVGIFRRD